MRNTLLAYRTTADLSVEVGKFRPDRLGGEVLQDRHVLVRGGVQHHLGPVAGEDLVQALRVAIPALVVSLFVSADMVSNMLNAIPEFVTRGLQIAGGFIVVVGYAMVLLSTAIKNVPEDTLEAARIDGASVRSMTRRSMPMPTPPVGGKPYSMAVM